MGTSSFIARTHQNFQSSRNKAIEWVDTRSIALFREIFIKKRNINLRLLAEIDDDQIPLAVIIRVEENFI